MKKDTYSREHLATTLDNISDTLNQALTELAIAQYQIKGFEDDGDRCIDKIDRLN